MSEMKKIIILILIAFAATVTFKVGFAHIGETEKSFDEVLSDILAKQNVTSISKIDCTKVFDAEFEELGDVLMERMAGSHELHEQMDEMMGGEGSESLRQMHVTMGKNWLGCGTDAADFQGMMGSGVMGGGMFGGGMMPMMMRMMGNYYPAFYTTYNTTLIFGIVGWILFAVLLAVLALVLVGKIRIQKIKR